MKLCPMLALKFYNSISDRSWYLKPCLFTWERPGKLGGQLSFLYQVINMSHHTSTVCKKNPKFQGKLVWVKKGFGEGRKRRKRTTESWGIRASIAKPWGEIRDVDRGITSVILKAAFVSKFTSSSFLASAKPYLPFLWNDINTGKAHQTVETTLIPHPK